MKAMLAVVPAVDGNPDAVLGHLSTQKTMLIQNLHSLHDTKHAFYDQGDASVTLYARARRQSARSRFATGNIRSRRESLISSLLELKFSG